MSKPNSSGLVKVVSFVCNVLAVLVSWYFNKSILWAIVAYLFGWWYLLYKIITGAFKGGVIEQMIQFYF